MLAQRIASALVLGLAALAAVLFMPAPWLAALFLVVVLIAAYEWVRLAGVTSRPVAVACLAAMSGIVAVLWLVPDWWRAALWAACAFWLAALGAVAHPGAAEALRAKPVALVAGALALAAAWLALVSISMASGADAPLLIIWLFVGTTAADTAAYFVGRRFGRRRLAPRISPGKTWEGATGGALALIAWGIAGSLVLEGGLGPWLAVAAVLTVLTVTGDLFESLLKRLRGVKDSGGILPGHGGVLDRVDSLLAAAPAYALVAPLLS